ncbi:VOC family protein [Kribbella sp. NPDC051770]|uniref:VOC family protein n=1 Tax=Kribbella sp. NPDC051770 TaxID=3155413 RepID=UPI003418FC92
MTDRVDSVLDANLTPRRQEIVREGLYSAGMGDTGVDWRVVDGVMTAWFGAASMGAGAALVGRVVELPVEVDLRASGVRVRVGSEGDAEMVSAAAREVGLVAEPGVLQQVSVVLESPEPDGVRSFWGRVLDYAVAGDGGLVDPLRRDPALRMGRSSEVRPLRQRVHLDVVRPGAVVERVRSGEPAGPYGVCHADADGNEVDLVPGDPLGESGADDWQAVFSAMVCYRTTTPTQQRELAAAAATLADATGFPLMVDLRPGLVLIDSGKDLWEQEAHGLDLDFAELAASLQKTARWLGVSADPELPRFVQLFLDAADVDAVRAFWMGALGYVADRRDGLSDIRDPRGLNPVLLFQELDASDVERRRQSNRMYFELAVPADVAEARLANMIAAGGRLIGQEDGRWRVADPEDNVLVIVS